MLDTLPEVSGTPLNPKPGPMVLDQVFLHPVDGLHQLPDPRVP